MADTKISALPAASALTGAEEFAANQGGASKKVTTAQVTTYVRAYTSGSTSELLPGYIEADVAGTFARLLIAAPDTDESDKALTQYRNMILMYEDVTDATTTRESRTIALRTGHFYIETAGGGLIHVDGTGSDPDIDLDNAQVRNFTAKNITVGDGVLSTTGTFCADVDARVSVVAPTVTMTTGGVGTGAFRDAVDARANAMSAARIQAGTASSGTVVAATAKTVTVTFPTAFSSAPKVTLTGISSDPGVDRRVSVVPGSETTTQFQIAFWRATGTASFDTNWLAVKP